MKNTSKKPKKFRNIGICAAAEDLGVTVMHLWYVLNGTRRSRRIEGSEFYRRTVAARRDFERKQKGQKDEETV